MVTTKTAGKKAAKKSAKKTSSIKSRVIDLSKGSQGVRVTAADRLTCPGTCQTLTVVITKAAKGASKLTVTV